MKGLLLLLVLLVGLQVTAQEVVDLGNDTQQPPVDGYVVVSDIESRKVVPYAPIRQTDVAYRKRIWREIDFREKINSALASPSANLIQILIDAIQAGELTAYDPTPTKENPTGDNFEKMEVLPIEQVLAKLGGDSVLVEQYNEDNEVISSSYQARDFDPQQVVKIRIKEDWIFDKQRAVFEPRIVGIAPLITPQIPGMGTDIGFDDPIPSSGASGADPFDPFAAPPTQLDSGETSTSDIPTPIATPQFVPQVDATPAFWIYFPEARHVLVNKGVNNRNNDATGLSFDDVFVKRLFSSYIVKESNPEDLRIKDYTPDELERLYESERIKKALTDYEQDLWSY